MTMYIPDSVLNPRSRAPPIVPGLPEESNTIRDEELLGVCAGKTCKNFEVSSHCLLILHSHSKD